MKITIPLVLIGLFVLLLLSTCSKDFVEPGIITPGVIPDNEDTTVTDDERWGIMNAMSAMSSALNNLETHNDRLQFCTWLKTIPQFNLVHMQGETIIARLRNGRILLVLNVPKADESGGRMQTSAADIVSDKASGRTADIPGATKVVLFNGLESPREDNTISVEKIFSQAKTVNGSQFSVKRDIATVAKLKDVSNAGAGIFYIAAHGVSGSFLVENTRDTLTFTGLMTAEGQTPALDNTYSGLLGRRELIASMGQSKWNYYITKEFVKAHMKFAENALIYVDACETFNSQAESGVFRDAFISKTKNQRGTYIGWDGRTEDQTCLNVSWFIFDRLLGTNMAKPAVPSLLHPQRPFDLESVMKDLPNQYLIPAADNSMIHWETNQIDEVIITPSIEYMEIDEYTSTLILHGLFGQKKGKVWVGDLALAVIGWSPNEIACGINKAGTGSFGNVVVDVNGIRSNTVPITAYDLKLNFATDDNGVKLDGYCNLRIRADIHQHRDKIRVPPKRTNNPDYSSSGSGYQFAAGSSAFYSISGNKFDQCNKQGCTVTYYDGAKPHSGTVPYDIIPSGAKLSGAYNWEPDQMAFRIDFLSVSTPPTQMHFEEQVICNVTTTVPADYETTLTFGLPDPAIGLVPRIEIAENYNIRKGGFSKTINRQWGNCSGAGKYTLSVSWELTQPQAAPTSDTPARKSM